MTYKARPIQVTAHIILSVGRIMANGSIHCALQNGFIAVATKEMISRFIPQEGDYWVIQEDGYQYVNPKVVFERNYEPVQ